MINHIKNSRRGLFTAIISGIILFNAAPLLALADLSSWIPQGAGNWEVQPGNTSVRQTINGNPTFFVSDFNVLGGRVTGQFLIHSGSGDDDFVGFVIGYTSPFDGSNNYNFIVFDWKQAAQASGGATGEQGFSIARTNGIIESANTMWDRANGVDPQYNLLAPQVNPGGWVADRTYQFELIFTTGTNGTIEIKVDLDGNGSFGTGETIYNLTNVNVPVGRFGFYNYSQGPVTYGNFAFETTVEDDRYTTPMGVPLIVTNANEGVLANDNDPVGGQPATGVTITITNQPDHGSVSMNNDGTFTYTPDDLYIGNDTFQYTVTNSVNETSEEATVTVRVYSNANWFGTGF